MYEYELYELIGIFIRIYMGVFLSVFMIKEENLEFGLFVSLITAMYGFLKLHDLSGLYPPVLWILFNYFEVILVFAMFLTLRKKQIIIRELIKGAQELHKTHIQ